MSWDFPVFIKICESCNDDANWFDIELKGERNVDGHYIPVIPTALLLTTQSSKVLKLKLLDRKKSPRYLKGTVVTAHTSLLYFRRCYDETTIWLFRYIFTVSRSVCVFSIGTVYHEKKKNCLYIALSVDILCSMQLSSFHMYWWSCY